MKPFIVTIIKFALALFLFWSTLQVRTPFFVPIRGYDVGGIIGVSVFLVFFEVLCLLKVIMPERSRRLHPSTRLQPRSGNNGTNLTSIWFSFGFIIFLIIVFCLTIKKEIQFNTEKQKVMQSSQTSEQTHESTPAASLKLSFSDLGQHLIVGYGDIEETKQLVKTGAVGGLFVSQKNAERKTLNQLKTEIAYLQNERKKAGLPPLLIATDQEGGGVSRLTPPLPQKPRLADIFKKSDSDEIDREAIREFTTNQATGLVDLGINLNFAPVVDVEQPIVYQGKYTRIDTRAISSDPVVVTQVASLYSKTLLQNGVIPTLKHFPGLGRVIADTHMTDATLDTSLQELELFDWIPFRTITKDHQAFIMLSHVKLNSLDPEYPVSFSKKVIQNIIRDQWSYDGILITDDLSMAAVFGSQFGVGNAAVASLNAGADFLLISYDKDLYYEAMSSLLEAQDEQKLDLNMIHKSNVRLKKVLSTLPF